MARKNKPLHDSERHVMITNAAAAYAKFMDIILPGWLDDPNSRETPGRVSKMYVNELLAGLNNLPPKITSFENNGDDHYTGMVFQGNIEIKSMCSHHHMPFFGMAHVAYIPLERGKIVGLSKLNRMVDFFARRPQVQENLTKQIHDYVSDMVEQPRGVAVMIEAQHTCVSHRGIGQDSTMKTSFLSGAFLEKDNHARQEFYDFIRDLKA